jgi:hypothetical protein
VKLHFVRCENTEVESINLDRWSHWTENSLRPIVFYVCRIAHNYYRYKLLILLQLFFRGKVQNEQGYVLYVRKNALQILIPKYGLEGTLYLSPHKGEKPSVTFVYNEEVLFYIHIYNLLSWNSLIRKVTGYRLDN